MFPFALSTPALRYNPGSPSVRIFKAEVQKQKANTEVHIPPNKSSFKPGVFKTGRGASCPRTSPAPPAPGSARGTPRGRSPGRRCLPGSPPPRTPPGSKAANARIGQVNMWDQIFGVQRHASMDRVSHVFDNPSGKEGKCTKFRLYLGELDSSIQKSASPRPAKTPSKKSRVTPRTLSAQSFSPRRLRGQRNQPDSSQRS